MNAMTYVNITSLKLYNTVAYNFNIIIVARISLDLATCAISPFGCQRNCRLIILPLSRSPLILS